MGKTRCKWYLVECFVQIFVTSTLNTETCKQPCYPLLEWFLLNPQTQAASKLSFYHTSGITGNSNICSKCYRQDFKLVALSTVWKETMHRYSCSMNDLKNGIHLF